MNKADSQHERQNFSQNPGSICDQASTSSLSYDLMAVFAHEIRSPLSVIANGLYILSQHHGSDILLDELHQTMARQIEHINRLVDSLVDCSPVLGQARLKKQRVELSSIVLRALEQARPSLERSRHCLYLDLPAEPLFLDADLLRLVQVLSNILDNAIKYTPPGGCIQLAAGLDGRNLRISVRDNGDGIAAEALPRLFEPFYRAPEVRWRDIQGTGLGLALVYGLMEAHGGGVDVSSAGPGQGTEVAVWLPVG